MAKNGGMQKRDPEAVVPLSAKPHHSNSKPLQFLSPAFFSVSPQSTAAAVDSIADVVVSFLPFMGRRMQRIPVHTGAQGGVTVIFLWEEDASGDIVFCVSYGRRIQLICQGKAH